MVAARELSERLRAPERLCEHPAVLEAAVVGEPDEYRGGNQSIVAFISLRTDWTTGDDELIDFTKERLAAYECPRTIHVIVGMPKTHEADARIGVSVSVRAR